MRAPPELTSERLSLRRVLDRDAAEILATYAQDPEVTRFLTWTPRSSVAQVSGFIVERTGLWEAGRSFTWVIRFLESNRLVGIIEARVDQHRLELGYVIARDCWGHGIATEAVRTLVSIAAAEPSIRCVWAYTDIDNATSGRVLEKAGLSRKGLLEGWAHHPNVGDVLRDCWVYSLRFD